MMLRCVAAGSLQLSVSLGNLPTSLTLISKYKTKDTCVSAYHRENGDMLLGCGNEVQIFSRDKQQVTPYVRDMVNVTVVEQQGTMFVLNHKGNARRVEMCLPNSTSKHRLLEFQQVDRMHLFVTASDRYVATTNRDTNEILLYDLLTKQATAAKTESSSNILHFLPDGDLLATGFRVDCLTKYRVNDGQLTKLWTCKGLRESCGICSGSDGLYYVTTWNRRTVYIVSPDGMKH